MSKERKFHEWIEQQNQEEKGRVWAKIQQKEEERLSSVQQETGDEQPVIPKGRRFLGGSGRRLRLLPWRLYFSACLQL